MKCLSTVARRALSIPAAASLSTKAKMQSVSIPISGNVADEFVEALMCFGASSCSIENANKEVHTPYFYLQVKVQKDDSEDGPALWEKAGGSRNLWNQSRITAIFPPEDDVVESVAFAADSLGLNEVPKYEVAEVEDCDWLQHVKDVFQPIEVASGLWIVPEWCTPPEPESLNVILNPGLAFGTGEHPTTRLCLRWLYETVKGGERTMDYGTGSGVLGIAALKMGALEAIGVDIDPMAVSSAASNAILNGVETQRFRVFIADNTGTEPVGESGTFDLVVANILLNPLVSLSSRIVEYAKVGGLVALSGIILQQVDRVREKYSPLLNDLRIVEDDGWACVIGTRKATN